MTLQYWPSLNPVKKGTRLSLWKIPLIKLRLNSLTFNWTQITRRQMLGNFRSVKYCDSTILWSRRQPPSTTFSVFTVVQLPTGLRGLGFGVRASCFKSVAHPQSFRLVVRSRVVWGNQCVFNPCELAKFARWLSQRHTTWNTCVVLMTMFRRISFQCVPLRGQNDLKMALNLEFLGDEERMRKKQIRKVPWHDTNTTI